MKMLPYRLRCAVTACAFVVGTALPARAFVLSDFNSIVPWQPDPDDRIVTLTTDFVTIGQTAMSVVVPGALQSNADGTNSRYANLAKGFNGPGWKSAITGGLTLLSIDATPDITVTQGQFWWSQVRLVINSQVGGWQELSLLNAPNGQTSTLQWQLTPQQVTNIAASEWFGFHLIGNFGGPGPANDQGLDPLAVSNIRYVFDNFQAIPEPSTYALVFGVTTLGLALWLRRRRR